MEKVPWLRGCRRWMHEDGGERARIPRAGRTGSPFVTALGPPQGRVVHIVTSRGSGLPHVVLGSRP